MHSIPIITRDDLSRKLMMVFHDLVMGVKHLEVSTL